MINIPVKFNIDNTDLDKALEKVLLIESKLKAIAIMETELADTIMGDLKEKMYKELVKISKNKKLLEKEVLKK